LEPAIVDPELARRLDAAQVGWCVIGAAALAAHGYVRASDDIDLLTLETRVLEAEFWTGAVVKIRRGDWDDPLAGSVLWPGAIQHDVVVGRGHAAREALGTAIYNDRLGARLATPLSMVLLKLEAGGAQDLYDILALMERRRLLDGADWIDRIAEHLPQLSSHAREAWGRMQTLMTPQRP
jgi:hypothetical protein